MAGGTNSSPKAEGKTSPQNSGRVVAIHSTIRSNSASPPLMYSSSLVKAAAVNSRSSPKLSRQGATPPSNPS
jgi:uncharacterized protein YkwD